MANDHVKVQSRNMQSSLSVSSYEVPAILAVDTPADSRSDGCSYHSEASPVAPPARTSRRGLLMNSIVSGASLASAIATATAVKDLPVAQAMPETTFPELVARFLHMRERMRVYHENPAAYATTDEHVRSIAWAEIDEELCSVTDLMLKQQPRSLVDIAWQAEAVRLCNDPGSSLTVRPGDEDDEIDDESRVRDLISNITTLAWPVGSCEHDIIKCPLQKSQSATDPIFAAIEGNKRAEAACTEVGRAQTKAENKFRDQYGTLHPDALSKEMRAAFASVAPNFADSRTTIHQQISNMRGKLPDEVVAAFHKELNRRTATYDETVRLAELSYEQALKELGETEATLLRTPPVTLAGLVAVVEHVCSNTTLFDTVASDLQTIA
jgi:hypothetical protein